MFIHDSGRASLPIYLINLDRDTERLAFVANQLRKLGLPFERVSAIHGTALPDWLKPYFLDASGAIASQLTAGEVGCYASHLMVMHTISQLGEPAIVMEDDLHVTKEFQETVAAALAHLPPGLDMLKLTLPGRRRHIPVRDLGGGAQIVKFRRVPVGTGAYLITPAAARRFIDWKRLRSFPIDQDLRRPWSCQLRIYGLTPAPAIQDIALSTIATFGALPESRRYYEGSLLVEAVRRACHEIAWLGPLTWLRGSWLGQRVQKIVPLRRTAQPLPRPAPAAVHPAGASAIDAPDQ